MSSIYLTSYKNADSSLPPHTNSVKIFILTEILGDHTVFEKHWYKGQA